MPPRTCSWTLLATLALTAFTAACGSESAPSPLPSSGGGGSSGSGEITSASAGRATGGAGAVGASKASAGADSGGQSEGGEPGGGGTEGDAPSCARDGDGRTTLVFTNSCAAPVTFHGSDIDGDTLAPSTSRCVDIGSDVETLSGKRYWGFRGQDPGAEHHSLAELTFNTDFNDFDWYDISYVDAFNLPLAITALARPKCKVLTCAQDFLKDCPSVGRLDDASGTQIACVSPERDDAMSPVALYFESCDDAYAWSGDDQHGDDPSPMRACAGEDWQIVFCPEAP